jgi:uncharacterized protein (DUF362 family)
MKKRKVIIRKCNDYTVSRIEGLIREGMEELREHPEGKILIKPNVVCATSFMKTAHTDSRVVEAMVSVLRKRNPGADITIGESGGMAIPTRLFFHHAGYSEMAKRVGVPLRDFNEERQVRVRLSRAKWHKSMLAAKSLYEAQYKIWMPKLKYHNGCHITNAVKLNIGILTHRERMLYHDDRLDEKIVDLLEPGYPDLIVSDAIEIGHGQEFSPYSYPAGALLIGNDPLAMDMVGSRILNVEPGEVAHLVEACARGYGSLDFNDIEVSGDVSIEELVTRTQKIDTPYTLRWDLEKIRTPISFYIGINPKTGRRCSGGCPNALAGALATSEVRWPGLIHHLERMVMVVGYYKGDVIHPDEKVALIGSCAGVDGRLEAKKIVRMKGCPAKGMDQALFLFPRMGIKTPAWSLSSAYEMAYFSMIKGGMYLLKPFRKKVGAPGVAEMEKA